MAVQDKCDDTGVISLGAQSEEKGSGAALVVVRIDFDVQQIVGVAIDGEIDVHPALHFAVRLVVLWDQDVLFIYADHTTGTHSTKERSHRQ